MHIRYLFLKIIPILLLSFVASAKETESEDFDPADILQTVNYFEIGYEYQSLNIEGAEGGRNILRLNYEAEVHERQLLIIESGFGYSNLDRHEGESFDGSGLVDTRVRFFHLAWPNENENENNGWQGLGYSLEALLPTGDIDKSTGLDQWVLAPGLIAKYTHNKDIKLFPLVSWVWKKPTSELEDFTGKDDETSAISTEMYITTHNDKGFYTVLRGAYQFGINNRDDSFLASARLGWMLSDTLTVGLEGEYSLEEEANGSWNRPELEPKYIVRLFVGSYDF